MRPAIDESIINKVTLLGEPCPTCGDKSNLSARLGDAGKTCIFHNGCGHLESVDTSWSDYVKNCITNGWIRFGPAGKTLVDPRALKPGMEIAVYREPAVNAKEGCFIASAVYGHTEASEVLALRQFRDTVLLQCSGGRAFVMIYYMWSPRIANFLSRNVRARMIVRGLLDRIVRRVRCRESDANIAAALVNTVK